MIDFEKALFPKPKMNPLILHPPVCSINVRYVSSLLVPMHLGVDGAGCSELNFNENK